jgi:hypothetical protein
LPGPEDPLRSALERLAPPADPAGAYERIVEKKIRRQIYRRLQAAALTVVVLAGTVGGTFALARVFQRDSGHKIAGGPIDNGTIVFVTNRNPPSQLPDYTMYRMDPDGTNLVQVTRQPIRSETVRLSGDSSQIAYSRGVGEGRGEIVIANADGSDQRVLTSLDDPQAPSWSPDGTRIAFFTGLGVDIYVMPVDGGGPTQLTNPPSDCGDISPVWSPSGDMIAFVRDCDGRGFSDVYIMNADGSDSRSVTDGHMRIIPPLSWSPDGKRIAFSVWAKDRRQIALIDLDRSGFQTLTTEGDNSSPAWSPSGKQIAFTSNRDGNQEIYVMSANGTGQRNLTNTPIDELAPSWQPVPIVIVPPSGPPTGSLSPSPPPSESTSPSPNPDCVGAKSVSSGDFDGDELRDTATVGPATCLPPAPPPPEGTADYSVGVIYGDGREVAYPITSCQSVCQSLFTTDLNADGIDELFIVVDQGASTSFLSVFELQNGETSGGLPTTVGLPGAPGFPTDQPAVFEYGGSVTHQGYVTCQTAKERVGEVVATTVALNGQQTEWRAHETVFTFAVIHGDGVPVPLFTVVSTSDYMQAFDPTGKQPFRPAGRACWDQGTSPSSSPGSVP